MSAAPDPRDWYRREFTGRAPRLAGAGIAWLAARRHDALEQFLRRGLPTRKDEDWKYTDVLPLASQRSAPARRAAIDPAALDAFVFDAWRLVFVDGRFAQDLSQLDGLPDGVRVASLAQTLRETPQALEGRLGRYVDGARHGFAALNLAFAEDGAVIDIAPGIELERPIQLLFVASGAAGADSIQHLRQVVALGAGARASLIESMVSLAPGAGLTTGVTEIELAAGAALDHYRVVQIGDDAARVDTAHVQQDRDSRYAAHAVTLGGRLVRHELDCALAGAGAECDFNGLYVMAGQSHIDTHTRFDHRVPHTTSRASAKGVLDDAARGVFSGRVVVHPDAQRSDAGQSVRHLLLSPRAEADSRPQLEIYADDVKCAHGAATGSLDPEQLFYLRSRGFDEPRARQLLVYAFAADMLARVPLAPLRERLAEQLTRRLLPDATREALTS
ncbi:MAG TPA: Fe-S cluster assembly protein SufD [Acidiferrobacterales bacterium]